MIWHLLERARDALTDTDQAEFDEWLQHQRETNNPPDEDRP